jgi:hypothetical protein
MYVERDILELNVVRAGTPLGERVPSQSFDD